MNIKNLTTLVLMALGLINYNLVAMQQLAYPVPGRLTESVKSRISYLNLKVPASCIRAAQELIRFGQEDSEYKDSCLWILEKEIINPLINFDESRGSIDFSNGEEGLISACGAFKIITEVRVWVNGFCQAQLQELKRVLGGMCIDEEEDEGYFMTCCHWFISRKTNDILFFEAVADESKGSVRNAIYALLNGGNVNTYDACGKTPLHNAAEGRKLFFVKFFLAIGAAVNSTVGQPLCENFWDEWRFRDKRYGYTALDIAAELGARDITSVLLSAGADANHEVKENIFTPDLSGDMEIKRMLREGLHENVATDHLW